jgi:hypothetical protein
MKNSISAGIFFIALSIQLIGCSNSRKEERARQTVLSADVAPGAVLIDVLESGRPEHYWQYEVRPATGWSHKIKDEEFQDYKHENVPHVFQQPSGAIEACAKNPEASSLDGGLLAYCSGSGTDEFFVTYKTTAQMLYHWRPAEPRRIRGFAWAPNSRSVAFLNVSSYWGKNPLELLGGLSGHPVPHDTIFLDVFDVRATTVTEYLIRANVPYSFTRILDWSE